MGPCELFVNWCWSIKIILEAVPRVNRWTGKLTVCPKGESGQRSVVSRPLMSSDKRQGKVCWWGNKGYTLGADDCTGSSSNNTTVGQRSPEGDASRCAQKWLLSSIQGQDQEACESTFLADSVQLHLYSSITANSQQTWGHELVMLVDFRNLI